MTPKASKTLPLAEASRLWSLYGFTSPKELILEDLAMAMNIFVVDARLDAAAARLVRKGDYGLIRVSDGLRLSGQRRFAIAHEIGHFVMHKKVSQLLACTDSDIRASYRSSPYEIEASIFAGGTADAAGSFFNPASQERFRQRMSSKISPVSSTPRLPPPHSGMSRQPKTIASSLCPRTTRFGGGGPVTPSAITIFGSTARTHCQGTVPRLRSSATEKRPTEPIEVDLKDWFGEMEDIDSDYVIEQAIVLPEFDQVISLIWLP